MNVILLERVGKLGTIGDVVRVKDGYARNFLLPQGKALRATEANTKKFEEKRVDIEAANQERREKADTEAGKLNGHTLIIIEQAGETGNLYGSVTGRLIADQLKEDGFQVERSHIQLNQPIKTIGIHNIEVMLHAEVSVNIDVNVARTPDEAERQAAGEDLRDLIAREDEIAAQELRESLDEIGAADEGEDEE